MYIDNGVFIDSSDLIQGRFAKLTYNGSMFQQGAQEVYVHLGFGLLWEGLREIKMTRSENGFEAEIPLVKADTLNFCFRDNWNNWDNNSYQNYSYEVKRYEASKPLDTINITEAVNDSINQLNHVAEIEANIYIDTNTVEMPVQSFKDTSASKVETSVPHVELSQSLVPTFDNEFSQFRRLPESYLRNKKLRIMFYRMFAYIPRLLNGYTKRRARSIFKNSRIM